MVSAEQKIRNKRRAEQGLSGRHQREELVGVKDGVVGCRSAWVGHGVAGISPEPDVIPLEAVKEVGASEAIVVENGP